MLYHFIDLSLVNSFILYKTTTPMVLYQFKMDVALGLMYGDVVENPEEIQAVMVENAVALTVSLHGDPVGAAEVVPAVRYDGINHLPSVAAKLGRCCKVVGCKSRSVVWCRKCRVYLCVKYPKNGESLNCFEKFHS